jgi:rhomboid protease GluP
MKAYQVFIGINVLFYIATVVMAVAFETLFSVDDGYSLVLFFGATNAEFVLQEFEVYRLLTAIFLHGGFLHLFVNMFSLTQVGPVVELIFKSWRFVFIYLISGLFGSLFSILFQSNAFSVGASGAIMGLVGALGVWALMSKNKEVLRVILINLVIIGAYGFLIPNIDNFGHLGGLVGGGLVAWYFLARNKKLLKMFQRQESPRTVKSPQWRDSVREWNE